MREPDPLFPMTEAAHGLSVHDLLREWFKYWRTVAACVLVVSLLAWGALLLQPPVYESSAKVWVQTEQQGTPSFLSGVAAYRESQDPEPIDRKIETEIQLLMSRSNAEAVVDQLGITKGQLVQAPLDVLKSFLPHTPPADPAAAKRSLRNDTVALFMKAVSVEPLRSKTADTTSNVFEAKFDCVDKNLAPRALKALVDEYFRFGATHARQLGDSAYRLVDTKTREQLGELRSLDDQILALTVQSASRPDVAMPGADTGEALDATLSSGRTGAPSGLGLLKSETIELQSKLEEARQLYTDDSPHVRHLMEQLAEVRSRLTVGVRASAELDERLERLERQRSLAIERFKELQTKRDQIELYLQLNTVISDTRVLTETPLQPDKAKTKTKIVIAGLAPLAGFFLGLLLAGIREYFDHRLQDPAAVDRFLGLETLAIVPKAAQ